MVDDILSRQQVYEGFTDSAEGMSGTWHMMVKDDYAFAILVDSELGLTVGQAKLRQVS